MKTYLFIMTYCPRIGVVIIAWTDPKISWNLAADRRSKWLKIKHLSARHFEPGAGYSACREKATNFHSGRASFAAPYLHFRGVNMRARKMYRP
jgi:hypothetical protein